MRWVPALALLALGCDERGLLADGEDTTTSTSSSSLPSAPTREPIDDGALFDPDHLVVVELELDPADWEALRNETRDFFDVLEGEDCLSEPFESPFQTYEAELVVDGEPLSRVGVTKKGFFGSLSYDRPSLRIETDEFVDGQALANGTERLVLNNVQQDPSFVSTCLGYGAFAAAGSPAPRCNFALVTVNGEELGVYVHVEAVKKDFLARHFASAEGDLYEGTISDFVDGFTGTFDPDTDATDEAKGPILALTAALEAPDDDLLAEVGAIVDLDAYYRFWALESLVAHWDGYASNTNNFFVYVDPSTGLMSFVPWGADALFGDPATPVAFTNGWLARRLWALPESRAAYLEAMADVLATWDEDALSAEIDRMGALIGPELADPFTASAYQDLTRDFVLGRREAVLDGIAGADDLVVDLTPPSADDWCLVDAGPITATFDTTWDSLDDDPFAGNPSTFLADLVPGVAYTGSVAGFDDYGAPVLAAVGVNLALTDLWQVVVFLPPEPQPGLVPLDLVTATAVLVHVDLTDPYDEGELWVILGELDLVEVGTDAGDPVVGTVTGEVYEGLL